MLTVSPFLTFQHIPANVGNDGVCVHNAVMNVGNKSMGVHHGHMCIYRKFGLGMKS